MISKSLGGLETEGLGILRDSVLVVVTCAGLSDGGHAVNLKLRAESAVAPDLIDGASSRLVELFQRSASKPIAAQDLCLLLYLGDLVVTQSGLPLCDTDEHVLLGLVEREDGSSLSSGLDGA